MKYKISATDLKYKVSDALNEVYYNGKTITIERHGKAIAKIVPVLANSKDDKALEKGLKETFGSIPDFPEVTKLRNFKPKRPGW